MMNDIAKASRTVARITLTAHQALNSRVIELFGTLGIRSLSIESARCVRQMMKNRFWGMPGLKAEFSDTATDIFRATVPSEAAEYVVCKIIDELGLRIPGRGAVYAQDMSEISCHEFPKIDVPKVNTDELLKDLALITGIQSKSGSGKNLFRIALQLGAGVPVVSLGIGSGIRDRLGLLRITISPEKELISLMVPSHDADGLQNLMIEEGHLNRPGGGFLYQTPLRCGLVDPLLRIGSQEHSASIEQIIAAVDDLKKGTAWRKRFFGIESTAESDSDTKFSHREISFICHDGQGDDFVHAAMQVGAEGATVSRVRKLNLGGDENERSIPCEHGILCISATIEDQILKALCGVAEGTSDQDWALQSFAAKSVFSNKRR